MSNTELLIPKQIATTSAWQWADASYSASLATSASDLASMLEDDLEDGSLNDAPSLDQASAWIEEIVSACKADAEYLAACKAAAEKRAEKRAERAAALEESKAYRPTQPVFEKGGEARAFYRNSGQGGLARGA